MGRPGPGRLIDLLVSRDPSSGQAIAPAVPGTPGSVWPGPQGHRRSSRAAARGGLTGGCPGRTRGHEEAAACPGEGGRRRPPFGDTVAGLPWGYFSRARPRAGHACRGRTFFSGLPAPPPARSGAAARTLRHRCPHVPAPLPARSGTAARTLRHRCPRTPGRRLPWAAAPLPAGPRRRSPRVAAPLAAGFPVALPGLRRRCPGAPWVTPCSPSGRRPASRTPWPRPRTSRPPSGCTRRCRRPR